MMTLTNQNPNSNFIEFGKVGNTLKGTIGAIGNFEMNIGFNFKYDDSNHCYYDPTQAATWQAWQGANIYIQYMPSGFSCVGDAWANSGSQTPFRWNTSTGQTYATGGAVFGSTTLPTSVNEVDISPS